VQSRLPGCFPHFTIGNVVIDVRHLFGRRVSSPESLWSAEVGYTLVRRDARPSQDNDTPSGIYPALNGLDVARRHAQILQYFCFRQDAAASSGFD
jgi:hypothetical protein